MPTCCTCEFPSDHNDPENPAYDRHEPDCDLSPDLTGWLFYEHDGELENGGVWVHPTDKRRIFLEVDGYLCAVPRGVPMQISDPREVTQSGETL
jgi:hypothetical protein